MYFVAEEQMGQIIQPVIQMNRTQMRAERVMQSMKRHNEDMSYKRETILEERECLKNELKDLLED